jgi:hypothetical protein
MSGWNISLISIYWKLNIMAKAKKSFPKPKSRKSVMKQLKRMVENTKIINKLSK